ncbi:hypothetical protein [Pseudomaricurvus sp. HS19]|uniref:hypothetical protein n=1 Tax=Pseudomaricurvus sp. HS19 TaxID=2692626 RepID=UPI001371FD60|nr:hypothetical protein [Pseudomaricurvus sp. HS19]MYM64374.1 hypothetical protein [Pseudomaricurvus sp. HS19]
MLNRRTLLPGLLLGLWVALPAMACEPRTSLEQVYCQLQARGETLPAWADFRRNPPSTQRLLLSRPAHRAGLQLPDAEPVSGLPEHPAAPPIVTQETVREAAPAVVPQKNCRLQRYSLLCGDQEFKLSGNLPNSRLEEGALETGNQLLLEEVASSDRADMIDNYRRYIEAMLSIGLGASTMSYTKFHHVWRSAAERGESPSRRFARMFEYLKSDKQRLAVQNRYGSALPRDISWCSPLGELLWVCDQKESNWVYVRR